MKRAGNSFTFKPSFDVAGKLHAIMIKRISILFMLLSTGVCCTAQMTPQTKKMTETFFPDPDIEMTTPAFLKKKGFTSYDELIGYINALQTKYSNILTISYIGTSQKGKQIPMIHIEKKNGNENKIKVWLQACLHGDEPASTEGMLFLLDKLMNDAAYSYLLDRLVISMVPMANIDGAGKLQRVAANGLDLNRDQTKLMAPESRYLKQAFSDFNAEVALDFHEYNPFRRDYLQLSTFGITSPYDVMLMYSGNLNVPPDLRNYTKSRFVTNVTQLLDEHKLTHYDYFTSEKVLGEIQIRQGSISARSSATSYALSNAISGLIEIRGGGLGRTSLKRRVYSTFLVAYSYLKTAYDHVDEIKTELNKAVENPNPDVVVKSATPVSKQKLTVLDLSSSSLIEIEVNLSDAWHTKPTLTRTRPTAYILLPTQEVLIEKMKILGLKIQLLTNDTDIEVENYRVVEYQKDAMETEGAFRQNIRTNTSLVTRRFPAGSYIVYMNQPRSNLAVEVLEPEAPNSFVSFSILPTDINQELPVYRYLAKTTL
jgi:hypothetical protein